MGGNLINYNLVRTGSVQNFTLLTLTIKFLLKTYEVSNIVSEPRILIKSLVGLKKHAKTQIWLRHEANC